MEQNDTHPHRISGSEGKNTELLEALYRLDLSDANDSDSFELRLSALNCWTAAHTARVVREYRRFIYLSQVSKLPVSPSDAVDQAWHLHLLQTRRYWDGLCRDVLGQALHHTPSTGDPESLQSDRDHYAATLVLYEEVFAEKPPTDIWPDPSVRFNCANDRVSISAAKLPMTNPNWMAHASAYGAVCVVIACTLAGSIFTTLPIFALSGAVFFWSFLLVLVVAVAIGKSSGWRSEPAELDSYEAAWLAGDAAHVGATAVATLLHLGLVRFDVQATGEHGAATCVPIEGAVKPTIGLHPCEKAALRALGVGPTAAAAFYQDDSLLAVTRRMRERLGRSGLALPGGHVESMPVHLSCIIALIMTVGVYRSTLDDPLADRFIVAVIAFLLLSSILWVLWFTASRRRVSSKGACALNACRSRIIRKYSRQMSASDFSKAFALQGSQFVMDDRRFYGINYFVGVGPPSNTGNTDDTVGCGNNGPRCSA